MTVSQELKEILFPKSRNERLIFEIASRNHQRKSAQGDISTVPMLKPFFLTVALVVVTRTRASMRFSSPQRRLSYATLGAGYSPSSQVTDQAAIDLDQKALEEQLSFGTSDSFTLAQKIYEDGVHSKSFAEVTLLSRLPGAIQEGARIIGKDVTGKEVKGQAMASATKGSLAIKIQYATADVQASYVNCQVGALEELGNTAGCFRSNGTLQVEGISDPISYIYNVTSDNKNGRTLAGFSKNAQEEMFDCPNCPYPDYLKFRDYYDQFDYGNQWVMAALSGGKTSFKNGNADFGVYGYEGLTEIIKKGTAYLNTWMYVIRKMEESLGKCQELNGESLRAWDEAVAFYTGSQSNKDDLTSGYLLYTLANKRCENFKTCGKDGGLTEGESKVNLDIFLLFKIGQQDLMKRKCTEAKMQKDRIVELMAIPLIQGTIRYAYLTSSKQDNVSEKSKAEGAVFAASVLPIVHYCNSDDAYTIYENLGVGSPPADFAAVKQAFEKNYNCMGISCSDVGGLYDDATSLYLDGAGPCSSGESGMSTGAVIGLTVGLLFASIFLLLAFFHLKRVHNRAEMDKKYSDAAPNEAEQTQDTVKIA